MTALPGENVSVVLPTTDLIVYGIQDSFDLMLINTLWLSDNPMIQGPWPVTMDKLRSYNQRLCQKYHTTDTSACQ